MKIAVASDGLNTSAHAVHCESFMCYTIDRGIITDARNLMNPGLSVSEAVDLFKSLNVDTLITGGIDIDFANLLCESGVEVVAGVVGNGRAAVEDYLADTLYDADRLCHMRFDDDEDDVDADSDLKAAFDFIEAQFAGLADLA